MVNHYPKDWRIVLLSELSIEGFQNGLFYEVARKNKGIPIINVGDLYKSSPIANDKLELFNATAEEIKRYQVFNGDLFFTRSSIVPSGIAFCNWYRCSEKKAVVFDSHVVRFKTNTDVVNPMYLYLACIRPDARKYFLANAKTATMTTIDQTVLGRCPIPYPALKEQTAIAEAVSDADSLISSMQKLIQKKKAIKQGALQELLTGKKRLPGFNEEWEELNFAESAKLKARIGWQGLTTSEYLQSGYAYLITGTDFHNGRIKWETCHFVDEKRYKQDLNIQIKKHDILLTKDGTIGKVAYISNVQKPTTLNSGVFVIRPAKEDSFDPNFVYHILNSFLFDNFLAKLSAGSTINHLYQKDFVDFTFKAPSKLVEQQAIAQVLSDMDSEIDQLEKKLAKYQQIKQGMMQELLTGRIRLKEGENNA